MRFSWICFFINLLISFTASSQKPFGEKVIDRFASFSGVQTTTADSSTATNQKNLSNPFLRIPIKTVPATYYKSTLGFFCKKELELEKTLNVSLKFRLGSVDYTDKMEGKGTGTRKF